MFQNEIKTALPGSTVWDNDDKAAVKGLHLRVAPTGKRIFFLYYRTKTGKQRRPKLGELGDITAAEARSRAKALMALVAIGQDPKGQWDGVKRELTLAELYDRAWKEHWSKPRYLTSGWANNVSKLWKSELKEEFGGLKLSEITQSSIKSWHRRYEVDAPYSGNRALEVLSRLFSFAEQEEVAALGSNPCRHVQAFTEKKRRRFATADELKKIFEILDREAATRPRAVAFLYCVIYSGSRPRAIERATWDQLKELVYRDQTFGVLTFSGKTTEDSGEEETVILPPQVMTLIHRLPKRPDNRIIGCRNSQVLWEKVRLEAGCPDLWARDLRRTFATIGLSDGVSSGTIGELLNHKSAQTTKLYAKLASPARLAAVSQISKRFDEIFTAKPTPLQANG